MAQITVKEYYAMRGISHQAAYKMIQIHQQELASHIQYIKSGKRTKMLIDDAGVAILDQIRMKAPAVQIDLSSQKKLEEATAECDRLRAENNALKDRMAAMSSDYMAMVKAKDARIDQLTDQALQIATTKPEEKKSFWQRLLGR